MAADAKTMESEGTKLVLTAICPHCGQRFESATQTEPKTWEGIRVVQDGMFERCGHCRRSALFVKGDYLFVTE